MGAAGILEKLIQAKPLHPRHGKAEGDGGSPSGMNPLIQVMRNKKM